MKKLITIISCSLLLLLLTGCGGGSSSSDDDTGGNNPPQGQYNPPQNGNSSVTLSWTPPATKINGAGLNDLVGYQILYGASRYALTNEVIISDPSISTFIIEGLSPAIYYFVVRAYNTNGVRAPYSNVVVVTAS